MLSKLSWSIVLVLLIVTFMYKVIVNNNTKQQQMANEYNLQAVGQKALVDKTRQRDQIVVPGDALGLFRAGRYDEAIVEFKGMLRSVSGKKLASVNNNLGLCYMRLKDYENAGSYFLQAVAIDPGYEKAHYNMALVYEKQGDMEGSRRWYAKTLTINPENKVAKEKLDAIENLFNTFPNLRNKPQGIPPPQEVKKETK